MRFDDDLTKYLPDYPANGTHITIEHLLTHTSGIPGYTESPKFAEVSRTDLSVQQIIDLIKDLPLLFVPGEQFAYSNSGYFLLGAIIEKASGMSYADFVAKKIFEPLGMKQTSYDRNEQIVANRASGYSKVNGVLQNAAYVSMTTPYAAGGLRSSVDDLVIWNAAMAAGKLLTSASWSRMFAPYQLKNGNTVPFPFGRILKDVQGAVAIDHGGRIDGFIADGLWLPDSKVYVAVLSNSDSAEATPAFLAQNLAALAMGKPYTANKPVTLDANALDRLVGVYRIDQNASRYVTREGTRLFIERTGGRKAEIVPTSATEFFYPNQFSLVKFVVDDRGEAVQMLMIQNGTEQSTPRVSNKPRVAIQLTTEMLDRLVGQYDLGPDFVFTITREGEHLMALVTGQSRLEVFARTESRFFYKAIDAELEFTRDAQGRSIKLTLYQGGKETSGPRQ